MASVQEQLDVLLSGITHVHSREELAAKLRKDKPLRIKLGFDPTSPHLHLGHALVLDKIRQFQDFGHTAVIIIGDYTARIGDPTGRSKTRPALDPEAIRANAETYKEQVFKILKKDQTEIRYNSEWFDKFTYADVLKLNSQISVAQLLEREDFKKRFNEGVSITLTEFQYPLMQGYDSVMVQSDVELGGNDQLFNNLVGRDLQKSAGQEPQVVIVMPILVGTDGVHKMSKSLHNDIGILESPSEMFGKTMSVSDETMLVWYSMLSSYHDLEAPAESQEMSEEADKTIKKFLEQMDKGFLSTKQVLEVAHPMFLKKKLARAIIARYHGPEAAAAAQADFEAKFSKKDLSTAEMPEFTLSQNPQNIIKLLLEIKAAPTSSEARRLLQQGAVKLDGEKVTTDPKSDITIRSGQVIQCGKKFFARLKVA